MSDSQKAQRPFDPAKPPPGVRLELSTIGAHLGISFAEMADAAGISRTAIWELACEARWPARTPREVIEAGLRALFSARGATGEQLSRLFHAHVSRSNPAEVPKTDHVGRPVGYRPQPRTDDANRQEELDMLMAKQTLTPAARKAFELLVNPFDGEVMEAAQMFTSPEIAYVRESCLQAARGGRFIAVVSESGGGKTTILDDLEDRIDRERMPFIAIRPWVLGMEDNDTRGKTLKSSDILASIISTLDPLGAVPQTLQARSNRARDLLAKGTEIGNRYFLVIEEAHALPNATLKHLKRLHEMRLGRRPLLGILLLGQPELGIRLDPSHAHLREVTQRCEVVRLLPLDADLRAYLEHRAQAAGRQLKDFIDAGAIEEMRARLTVTRLGAGGKARSVSMLYPLAVNNFMTACLNVAAEEGEPVVTRDVVRAV